MKFSAKLLTTQELGGTFPASEDDEPRRLGGSSTE